MPRDSSRGKPSGLGSQVVASNGFFASASRKQIKKTGKRHKIEQDEWQRECWRMFDTVGEYHSACTWISNVISKAKFTLMYEGKQVQPGDTKHEEALNALESLFGGPEEQSEMLRLLGLHLSVAGDSYIVALSGGSDDDDEWDVLSNLTVKPSGNWYRLDGDDEDLPQQALVIRLWRKHPLNRKKGDSNSRAALPILSELEVMTQRVAADSESRLVGAGLLLIPNEVTFPTRQLEEGEEDKVVREGASGFMDMLIDVAELAIGDPSSASAKVPIVVQMPGDQIAKVKLVNFWSEYDSAMKELRAEAIRRLSLALDMPPEVLTGLGDANHWSAWQMEEAAIKVHTEPLLKLVLASLNEGYLWPYLDDDSMAEDEVRKYSLGADTSEMRLRPNKSKEALELHDRGILKDAAVVRENGFTPDDMMSPEERADWLVRKMAQGSPTPEMVLGAVAALGGDMAKFQGVLAQLAPDEAREDAPLPRSLGEHPNRSIPDTREDVSEPIAAASEVVVLRVLERAGNRLKNRLGSGRPDGVPAAALYQFATLSNADVDELLEDAWGICDEISTAVPRAQLEAYVRNRMTSAKPHDVATLRRYLALAAYALGDVA